MTPVRGDRPGGLEDLAREEFCYLTTTGRATGMNHTIEMWFAVDRASLYMLSGGGDTSDWVRNLMKKPEVTVRTSGRELRGRGRLVTAAAEDAVARNLLFTKYESGYRGDLTSWRDRAVPVAVDLDNVT